VSGRLGVAVGWAEGERCGKGLGSGLLLSLDILKWGKAVDIQA